MGFKMTVAGLVKRIRAAKDSTIWAAEKPGWYPIKVNGLEIKFHTCSVEFAKAHGFSEVWARVGEMGEEGFKEYRGSAEKVAAEILGVAS